MIKLTIEGETIKELKENMMEVGKALFPDESIVIPLPNIEPENVPKDEPKPAKPKRRRRRAKKKAEPEPEIVASPDAQMEGAESKPNDDEEPLDHEAIFSAMIKLSVKRSRTLLTKHGFTRFGEAKGEALDALAREARDILAAVQ